MKSAIQPAAIRKLITVALMASISVGVLLSGIANAYVKPSNRELLRSLKCEYGQGYFFSKPVDTEKATALLFEDPSGPGYLSVDALLALEPATALVH